MSPATTTYTKGGWRNVCTTCGQWYWVSDRDIHKPKMVHYADDTYTEPHRCPQMELFSTDGEPTTEPEQPEKPEEPELRRFSHSLIDSYLRCPRQNYYRYIEKLDRPKPLALVKGSACDNAWNYDLERKIETGDDLPVADLLEITERAFRDEVDAAGGVDSVDWQDTTPKGALDSTLALSRVWVQQLAPDIVPKAVQVRIERTLPSGRTFIGFLDIEGYAEGAAAVIDNKTGKRAMARNDARYNLQPYAYAWLKQEPIDFAFARAIDTGKSQKSEIVWTSRSAEDVAVYDDIVTSVEQAWERGDFPTKPSAMACGMCQYRDVCPVGTAIETRNGEPQ